MRRFERKKLEPLTIEYEDEEVFLEAIPQSGTGLRKMTSYHGSSMASHQTSTRSVHSASCVDGNKFVFDSKEQLISSNLLPSMGFKRKWSKRKKDLKLRYCIKFTVLNKRRSSGRVLCQGFEVC